jgi:hypothetical protein
MLRIRNQYGDWVAITDGGFTEDWNPRNAWYKRAKVSQQSPFARKQATPQVVCEQNRANCLRSMNQNAAINAKLGINGPVSNNVQINKCYDDYDQCMKNRIASNYPVQPFEIDPLDAMALSREITFE